MNNMTALVSAFARAYTCRNCSPPVFAEPVAERMLTKDEYDAIAHHMSQGIRFFAPGFEGSPEEALRLIMDRQLAPSVLARSAFCERAINHAVRTGCRQIVLYACGYDTFSLRTDNPALAVFELDRPDMIADRQKRIAAAGLHPVCRVQSIGCDLSRPSWKEKLPEAGFDEKRLSFGSLLGISYYLTKEAFADLLRTIAGIACEGSSVCFDYPLREEGAEARRTRQLAAAAGEEMKAKYAPDELEEMLHGAGFAVKEHLNAAGAAEAFFQEYNLRHPGRGMDAPEGVGYCLAVRKRQEER